MSREKEKVMNSPAANVMIFAYAKNYELLAQYYEFACANVMETAGVLFYGSLFEGAVSGS